MPNVEGIFDDKETNSAGLMTKFLRHSGFVIDSSFEIRISSFMWRFGRLWLGAFAFNRHLFFRRDVVLGFRDAQQPLVEPADNILQSLDPVPRLARTPKLLPFVKQAHHPYQNF